RRGERCPRGARPRARAPRPGRRRARGAASSTRWRRRSARGRRRRSHAGAPGGPRRHGGASSCPCRPRLLRRRRSANARARTWRRPDPAGSGAPPRARSSSPGYHFRRWYDAVMGELSPAALAAWAERLGTATLGNGNWFQGLLARQLALHGERAADRHVQPGVSVEDRARREVRKAAMKTAATGAVAATLATSGELATLFTDGLAGAGGAAGAPLSALVAGPGNARLQ